MAITYIPQKYVDPALLAGVLASLFLPGTYSVTVGSLDATGSKIASKADFEQENNEQVLITADRELTKVTKKIDHLRIQGPRSFVDTSRISNLFAEGEIPKILAECGAGPYEIENYGNLIESKAQKLFAILVWIKEPLCIISLVQCQIYDKKLPLTPEGLHRLPGISLIYPQFFEAQYEFLPHFFERGIHSHLHNDKVILPFRNVQRLDDLDGASGSISRVTIHPSFHNLLPTSEPEQSFIQKQVSSSSGPASFQREKRNLELLHCMKHPNIVKLLCSYTTVTTTTTVNSDGIETTTDHCQHYFLFPEEPLDLHKFLQKPQPYGLFAKSETYYLALQDLSSALDCVHDFKLTKDTHMVDLDKTGSHRDIRLPNILVRSNTFLLADFGLSDFKDLNYPRGTKTIFKAGRGDYLSPECYGAAFNRQAVGRSMDIWAFGCMLIDVATYMETGAYGLKKFQEKRIGPWFPPFKNGFFFHEDALKPVVLEHLSNLRTSSNDRAYIKLLQLTQLMLKMRVEERLTAREVSHGLRYICTVKLYEQLIAALIEYDSSLATANDIEHSRIIQWFEMERLRSWADMLGLQKDAGSSFQDLQDVIDVKTSQTLLTALKNDVQRHHARMENGVHSDQDGSQWAELHSQFEENLSQYVRRLFSVLPHRLQKRADIWWTQRLLHGSTQDTLTAYTAQSRSSGSESYKQLGRRALVKRNLLGISDNVGHISDLAQLCLDRSRLTGEHKYGNHKYGRYRKGSKSLRILIEYVDLAKSGTSGINISADETAIRKTTLARLFATPGKPTDFRVLDCIGFADDKISGRNIAKFVYKLPECYQDDLTSHQPRTDPQSLLVFLEKRRSGEAQIPPLEQRIKLAQALVTSLHSLHLNGWLHKSLNADNILLFETLAGTHDLDEPRIVGFRDSRPDGDIWTSSGPNESSELDDYVHAAYRKANDKKTTADSVNQERFRRVYDYYSLGLILLEIGLWRSLRSMLKYIPTQEPELRRGVLLSKYWPRLGELMGSNYARVVKKCIDTSFSEEQPATGAEEQLNELYLEVVEPITDMYI